MDHPPLSPLPSREGRKNNHLPRWEGRKNCHLPRREGARVRGLCLCSPSCVMPHARSAAIQWPAKGVRAKNDEVQEATPAVGIRRRARPFDWMPLTRILHESGMPHIRARPKGEYLHRPVHFPWAQTVPFAAPPADAPFAFPPKALCSILKVYSCNMRAK